MSTKGDDCYFYFYSTCTKGDDCAFRHCQAALGNETVCTLWQEGCCFRQNCKYRHMEIDKKRSEIPCFWENKQSGCQKGNCAFHHIKGRYVDGVFIPPSRTQLDKPEPTEPEVQTTQAPIKHPVAPTPQIRGVKKIEAVENVPSPTHPPVVINAADDDEDDDDQFSEEGDELKNSGQQFLSSVRHQGTRLVSCKGAIVKSDALDPSLIPKVKNMTTNRIFTFTRSVTGSHSKHLSLAQRLGNRNVSLQDSEFGTFSGENFPGVKKPLSERLGKKIKMPSDGLAAQAIKVQRPLKDRLGFPAEQNGTVIEKAANSTAEFHIKTLQEILQEKASQRQDQEPAFLTDSTEEHIGVKSRLFTKPQPNVHVKSLREIQTEKRLRQLKDDLRKDENEVKESEFKVGKGLQTALQHSGVQHFTSTKKRECQTDIIRSIRSEIGMRRANIRDTIASSVSSNKPLPVSSKETKSNSQPMEEVRVKTLEEIRKEKALRLQQNPEITTPQGFETASKPQVHFRRRKILRIPKPQVNKEADKGATDINSSSKNTATVGNAKITEDLGPHFSAPLKILEKKDIGNTNETPYLKTSKITHIQEISDALRPTKMTHRKKIKDKPVVNVEPCIVTKPSPATATVKRKTPKNSTAEVKPLSTVTTSIVKEQAEVFLPMTEPSVPEDTLVNSPPPKRLKESSQISTLEPCLPVTAHAALKSRRTSIASVGKPSVSTEDDIDELIWDISGDKLEDEIVLDPSKDEDDLLMELSEMIDS